MGDQWKALKTQFPTYQQALIEIADLQDQLRHQYAAYVFGDDSKVTGFSEAVAVNEYDGNTPMAHLSFIRQDDNRVVFTALIGSIELKFILPEEKARLMHWHMEEWFTTG